MRYNANMSKQARQDVWRSWVWATAVALLLIAGCDAAIDAPETPTIPASPTEDATAIALRSTPTASATRTPTPRPTVTSTVSPTAIATATATATAAPSATPTLAPSITLTPSWTPTRRPSPTALPPSPTASATPTAPILQAVVPTATRYPTATFTPFPSITPNATQTAIAQNPIFGPIPTSTPGGIITLTPAPPATTVPSPSPVPPSAGDDALTPAADAPGTFYDPNGPPAADIALPPGQPSDSGPGGSQPANLPEQAAIVVSYAGQVVPILDLQTTSAPNSAALASGTVFAVGANGQVAAVGQDRQLYVNGAPLAISPASEFGLPENLSFGDLVWSPDGHRLAVRVDAANPHHANAIDAGVWIIEPYSGRSWQVFRTGFPGQVAQLHQERRPLRIQWSPDGGGVLIQVATPLGRANVALSYQHDANVFVDNRQFAHASWSTDSRALIVSGTAWAGGTRVGRIALDGAGAYTEYLTERDTGLAMQYATELPNGWIAFVGSAAPGTFALYLVPPGPGIAPSAMTQTIPGEIVGAEWNPARTALLATVQTPGGVRLWLLRTDGVARDITPSAGAPDVAHWR